MTNLADQRQVEKRTKDIKKQAARHDDGLRAMLASKPALGYLGALVRESQAMANVVGATEQGAMFREGRRVLGLKIMADVQRVAPDKLASLIAAVLEQPEEEKNDRSDDE